MKQLETDPWEGVERQVPGRRPKFTGRVTNITDYGAFVELEPGVEGLVHVSEMSWTKKNVHPGKIVSTSAGGRGDGARGRPGQAPHLARPQAVPGQSVGGLRREASRRQPSVEGEVRNITEFGLFVGLDGDIDGMVHLSDLDWELAGEEAIKDYKKGDMVQAVRCSTSTSRRSASRSASSSSPSDPFGADPGIKKGDAVTCTGGAGSGNGIEVKIAGTGVTGFIRKVELARDRSEQRPERFAVGEKVDAKVIKIDKAARQVRLSIKALEIDEEKQAMAEFGSSDTGASLGDILGAALSKAKAKGETSGRE